ncbi:uncharacterized protein LOC117645772 [Thrips palmi]|uniref:Uncharacterized protein LOC117645772 n=1 Tax=Thrips palmi TaxID=161013 RepID=A0A6P8ZNB5_THRPL|nr:uncharacterized protein LOC117645772 [Thrips palmi]
MSALTHGGITEDMSTDLRSVLLLGPKPRPPIGGPYHPNARQRQAAEAGARRQRVQRLLRIHEYRKGLVRMERGLEASRATLLAMEEEAGVDAMETLAQFKSPAVPSMLGRKRRLRDALAECGRCQDGEHGETFDAFNAVKRHRLEVPDDRPRARRSLHDGLDDGVGVVLRHKRLVALQDEERVRRQLVDVEVLRDDARRRKRFAAAQDEEVGRHRVEVLQDDGLRHKRRLAVQDGAVRHHRSEVVQDDAVRHHRSAVVQDDAVDGAVLRYRREAQEQVDASHRYQHVVRELKEAQKDLKIEVTASSDDRPSPPRPRRLLMVDDEDVSPMEMTWLRKPGLEPATPGDAIPSPLFMRVPRGVPGATPDRLCRSPDAACRSPNALCRSPSAR